MGRHIRHRRLHFSILFSLAVAAASCGGSSTTVLAPGAAADRCAVTVSASPPTVGAAGGPGSVRVDTGRECQWVATAEASWITIPSGASGQGPNTLAYTVAANSAASVRRGTIAVNGQRVEITQDAAPCVVSISTSAVQLGSSGGAASVTLTTQDSCAWTVTSRASWITVTSRASGSGSAEVAFDVAANAGAARDGAVEIAGQQVTVSQAGPPAAGCSFTIAPPSAAVGADGSQTTVTVSAPANCAWSAVSGVPWITIAGSSTRTGNGSVVLQISANSGVARTAQVSIAGRPFTVAQAAAAVACTYSVTPETRSIAAGGGVTTAAVVAQSGCAWSTTGAPPWIAVSNGNGSGDGTVTLTVETNSGTARTATLTIAGRPFLIEQQAASAPSCSYELNPTSHSALAGGGTFTVAVATGSGCSWSTTAVPSWITVTNVSGTGAGTVTLTVQANSGAARSTTLTIAGQSFTVNQAPAPCSYSIAPESHSAAAAGGQTAVTVSTATGCTWSTTGLPSWITFTTGNGTGSGNGSVDLTVQANTGAARSATLTIAGQSFTVSQAEAPPACSYTVTPTTINVDEGQHSGQQALTIAVQTTSQCSWSATVAGGTPWLSIRSGATGTGGGTVLVDVERNRDSARTGTLTVAGRTVTINQEGGRNE